MVTVRYEVVEHDGGWAYRVADVLSETFPIHDAALAAANEAAARQQLSGETDGITYQDDDGRWHEEVADGRDRPATQVVDQD